MESIDVYNSETNLLKNKELIEELNEYNLKFNKSPIENEVKLNKFANNSKYLPISFLEMKLDTMLLGLWQTKNFQYQVIANEIVGSLELIYFHPIAKQWLSRTGAGAVQIQMISVKNGGSGDITDIKQKIINTLTKDFPHLKAECFRNACLSLGKSFGRDLNREHKAEFNEFHTNKISKLQQQQLKQIVDAKKIQIDKVKDLINSYGFNSSAEITQDLFDIIIGELRNGLL